MARFITAIRLSGYGAAYFFAAGALMSYWPVWLRDRGVQDAEIGTLYMSRQLVSVGATLLVGVVAHRLGNARGVILALAAAATLLMTGYQFAYGFLAILAVSLVWGGVWAPTMALYDGVLVNETRARGFNYGSLRLWGSLAFILGAVLCGVAVDRNGPAWVLYVGFSGIVLLVPLALLLPKAQAHHRDARRAPFGMLDLLSSPPFLLFMAATGLCQASHAVLYSFGTLTWRAAGIDDVTISLLLGTKRRCRDPADVGQRPAAAAPGRVRHAGLRTCLRHGAMAGHGLHDGARGAGLPAGPARRLVRGLPSRRHGLHAARAAGVGSGAGPERVLRTRHRRGAGGDLPAGGLALCRVRSEGNSLACSP